MVSQMLNQSLEPPICHCDRVAPPQVTPVPSDLLAEQQQATVFATESLSLEGCAGVRTTVKGGLWD